jgi:ribonuclease T1
MDYRRRIPKWSLAAAWLLAGLFFLLPPVGAGEGGPDQAALPEIAAGELPPEARRTIALIRKGGPYPHERDGIVFGNYEGLLPAGARGYYREYGVRTPGAKDRGARRIVAGRGGELYYTDDHYRSFRRIREDR